MFCISYNLSGGLGEKTRQKLQKNPKNITVSDWEDESNKE